MGITRHTCVIVLSCCFGWVALGTASAGEAQCAAPRIKLAIPGEERPVKGNHRFDAAEPDRALASFAPIPAHLRGSIRRVELPKGSRKLVALTFDLCEQPGEVAGYDGAIFDYLRSQKIKATLFTGGKWMRSHPERFQQLLGDPLFEIANHASAHRNLRLLTGAALRNEIVGPQRAYEAIRSQAAQQQCFAPTVSRLPERLGLFRFPYGACNAASLAAVNDEGLLAIQWDVATGDPSPGTNAGEIAHAIVRGVKPGSIVISHANGRGFHTAEGLPLAIPKLRAAGYEFVTVSELLAAGTPVIASSCYDSRPGDTDRYDHLLGLRVAKASPLPGFGAPPNAAPRKSESPAQVRERLPWQ